jgi:thymidylate synthase (FAD)
MSLQTSASPAASDLNPKSPFVVEPPGPLAVSGQGVEVTSPEAPLVDVMGGQARRTIKVLDHGFVALVDAMPRLVPQGQTADQAIVQAARVSYGQGTKKVSEDQGLIRYLLRHRHTTPFEMVEFKFHISMPIFIARQWIRHRTANVNEYSGRYSVMPDRFYRPSAEQVRRQSASNRQGGSERLGASAEDRLTGEAFAQFLAESEALYTKYRDLVDRGVSREMARIGLPVSLYTEWYWKIDLHNLLHFLSLRMDAHAQEEIQLYARAMHDLVAPIVPVTMAAWKDYAMGSVRLSRLEVDALRAEVVALKRAAGQAPVPEPGVALATDNKRENDEWQAKRRELGLYKSLM